MEAGRLNDAERVLTLWAGLGYYRRAKNLMAAAREIVEKHGGKIPSDHEALLELPGIGPYMAGVDFLKNCPKNKGVQVGVLDIRTSMVETPAAIADRIRTTLKYLSPEQVVLSTDCGMKPLSRMVAKLKLKTLAEGAAIVRKEVGGR